jgi:hypothetical protein
VMDPSRDACYNHDVMERGGNSEEGIVRSRIMGCGMSFPFKGGSVHEILWAFTAHFYDFNYL